MNLDRRTGFVKGYALVCWRREGRSAGRRLTLVDRLAAAAAVAVSAARAPTRLADSCPVAPSVALPPSPSLQQVEYGSKGEAQAAIEGQDGKELLTQVVSVNWAFSSGPIRRRR